MPSETEPDTTPQTSKYQETPWQPEVVTSAGDADTQKAAAATYTGIYGGTATVLDEERPETKSEPPDANETMVPVLSTAYFAPPSLVGYDRVPTGASASAEEATALNITIDLGGLRTTQQKCLTATNEAVAGYETLRATVATATASSTIFGQNVGRFHERSSVALPNGPEIPASVTADPLSKMGVDFAAAINPEMQQALQTVAGAIEMMGVFNALLNNAGQIYAQTDHDSRFDG